MAKRPAIKSKSASSKPVVGKTGIMPPKNGEGKKWPRCMMCPGDSVMSRTVKGKKEHYCAHHWPSRAERNLPVSNAMKVGLKPKAKRAIKVKVKK